VAVLALMLANAPAAGAKGRHVDLGHLAGYVWTRGNVGSVGAAFAVPRIRPGSRAGSVAATWIGAQAPGVAGPFIQVGVTEIRTAAVADLPPHNLYVAFWSDTRLRFRAQILFEVIPGDTIVASLRHRHDGWKVAIVDATRRVARRLFTRDEARAPFNWAEWLQENPHTSTGRQLPYPRLSAVRFTDMWMNSVTPRQLASQWLSTPRGQFGPTRLRGGSFRLARKHLSGLAATFWRLAIPYDAAHDAFDARAVRWRAHTPTRAIAAASATFARALRANVSGFARARWPAPARPAVRALIARALALLRIVEAAPRRVPTHPRRWIASYQRASIAVHRASARILAGRRTPDLAG
jgi:hypothetical protein